jgi:hypothetical protein
MMGQNQPLELSEEEKKELSAELLREWCFAATNALVAEVGSNVALAHQRPYCLNGGIACAIQIKKLTNFPTNDAGQIASLWFGIPNTLTFPGTRRIRVSSKDLAFGEVTDCVNKGRCWELCHGVCITMASKGCVEINPDFETELIRCVWWGDKDCCFRILRLNTNPSLPPTVEIPIPTLPPELLKFLELAYVGELWVIATRSFLDALGAETTNLRLRTEMMKSGRSMGERFAGRVNADKNGLGNFIHLLNELHNKKESCSIEREETKCEVTECPFSSSPPEICLQYEAFFNGICEAIDPSFEFKYDRMMTKGDKTCHWTIRKKGETANEKSKEEVSPDDPVKRLTNKFIDGEITEEEYEKKMTIIKKHYPR